MAKVDPPDGMLLLLGDMVDRQLAYLASSTMVSSGMGRFVSLKNGETTRAESLDYPGIM